MITEKKTGEKYPSKSAMMKHEKKESKSYQKKEVKKTPPTKQTITPRPQPRVKASIVSKEEMPAKQLKSAKRSIASSKPAPKMKKC